MAYRKGVRTDSQYTQYSRLGNNNLVSNHDPEMSMLVSRRYPRANVGDTNTNVTSRTSELDSG
jgi:hypothetical protein